MLQIDATKLQKLLSSVDTPGTTLDFHPHEAIFESGSTDEHSRYSYSIDSSVECFVRVIELINVRQDLVLSLLIPVSERVMQMLAHKPIVFEHLEALIKQDMKLEEPASILIQSKLAPEWIASGAKVLRVLKLPTAQMVPSELLSRLNQSQLTVECSVTKWKSRFYRALRYQYSL